MHRKVLISLAFAGTAAFLAAQALVRSPGQGAAGAPGGPGAGVTGPMAKRADTAFNAIQQVLHEYIVADTNHLIDVAQETGKDSTVSKMIESQCYHLLTLMDDAQRDHEINGVWQVKVWKPGGQWNHVTEAPKKAKAILNA